MAEREAFGVSDALLLTLALPLAEERVVSNGIGELLDVALTPLLPLLLPLLLALLLPLLLVLPLTLGLPLSLTLALPLTLPLDCSGNVADAVGDTSLEINGLLEAEPE